MSIAPRVMGIRFPDARLGAGDSGIGGRGRFPRADLSAQNALITSASMTITPSQCTESMTVSLALDP